MWAGIAEMREHVIGVLDALPAKYLRAGPSAGRRRGASAPRAGDLGLHNGFHPQLRTGAAERSESARCGEEERYGEVWRKLVNDLARAGGLRPELDLYIAQMLVLGALNWTVEWWDSRRGSVDAVVANAQTLVRHGLTDVRTTKRRVAEGLRAPAVARTPFTIDPQFNLC